MASLLVHPKTRQTILVHRINSKPKFETHGIIPVSSCLTVKGAEDVLNRQFAFEFPTRCDTMYFITDSDKDKEDWINSIGRSIVQHFRSVTDHEIDDYDHHNN
ncbi:Pleckstrin homology domain-containing protein 1 [Bienertia sinuspersici]